MLLTTLDSALAGKLGGLTPKDIDRIKAKADELSKVLQEVGTSVYQQQAAQQQKQQGPEGAGAGAGAETTQPPPSGEGDKVVDADYKVK